MIVSKKVWGFQIFGIVLFLSGMILLGSSLSITGFSVLNESAKDSRVIWGTLLTVLGALIAFVSYRTVDSAVEDEESEEFSQGQRRIHKHRRVAENEAANAEAEFILRQKFKEERGRYPNHQELNQYMRHYHETGQIPDIVEEYRRRKKGGYENQ